MKTIGQGTPKNGTARPPLRFIQGPFWVFLCIEDEESWRLLAEPSNSKLNLLFNFPLMLYEGKSTYAVCECAMAQSGGVQVTVTALWEYPVRVNTKKLCSNFKRWFYIYSF
jgi:hypothetical protein